MVREDPRFSAGKAARQYAALPIRTTDEGALEVLLVTSRDTGRWIIPKGWPIPGRTPSETAAREAYEEAGVIGTLERGGPAGRYTYRKRLSDGRSQVVSVDVFILRVARQRRKWPERAQRSTRWHDLAIASELVDEPALAKLLLSMANLPDILI